MLIVRRPVRRTIEFVTPQGRIVIRVLAARQGFVELGFTMPQGFRYVKDGRPGGRRGNDENRLPGSSPPPTDAGSDTGSS